MIRFTTSTILLGMVFGLLGAGPSVAQEPQMDSSAGIAEAESLGRTLFLHERAAALAIQIAGRDEGFRHDQRIASWITELHEDAIAVTFLDATPLVLYRVLIDARPDSADGNRLQTFATPTPLSAYEAGAVAARSVALSTEVESCARARHTVVLPQAQRPGHWQVYLLPATQRADEIPVGGTHRIDTDGRTVSFQRSFAESCLALERDPRSIGVMIANALDPVPNEAHVFWSLWADLPMFVGTDTGLWSIENGSIRPPVGANSALHAVGLDDAGLGIEANVAFGDIR